MRTYFIVAAVALAIGLVSGWFLKPAPAPGKATERIVYKDRDRVVTVKGETEVKRVIVYREKTTKPDGTVTEREAEHVNTDTRATETTKAKATTTATTERAATTVRPDWRVGVLAGGSLTPPLLPLSAVPLAVGIHVERRILGPLSVGVWGLSSGQAGASLSMEF